MSGTDVSVSIELDLRGREGEADSHSIAVNRNNKQVVQLSIWLILEDMLIKM